MRVRLWMAVIIAVLMANAQPTRASSSSNTDTSGDTAIVLASFGTTVPRALSAIVNIQQQVEAAFPGVPVRLTFTSNIIRSVWRKRRGQADQWRARGVPEPVLEAENLLTTFGRLRDQGVRNVVVQPTHLFFMEQSHDLAAYVNAIRSIRTIQPRWQPFDRIALGRPAMGTVGRRYDYREDMKNVVDTLAADAALAARQNAVLVYMGHGNDYWPSSIYDELARMMNARYAPVTTLVGTVEGYPPIDVVLERLKAGTRRRVIVKPLMIVAGDHAVNDMAGQTPDSWASVLKANGFDVRPMLEGLGDRDAFARIFVDHIRDAARDAGIVLAPEEK